MSKENDGPIVTPIRPVQRYESRVVIYCRVSSKSQEQLQSLTSQVSQLTKLVAAKPGWYLKDIYLDIRSGREVASRTEFQRMMNDCAARKIDRIVTKSISRFGRHTSDTLAAINTLRVLGVDVYFADEEIHTDDGNTILVSSVLEAVAQEENANRSENVRWGILRRIENGKSRIFDRKCFGYVQNDQGVLRVQDQEAAVVRLIYDLYLRGYSIIAIGRELEGQGIHSPTGKPHWNKRTLDTILGNEKYIGDVLVMKSYNDTYPSTKRKLNKGEKSCYLASNAHPAIISREQFQAVEEERNRRSNTVKNETSTTRSPTRYSMKRSGIPNPPPKPGARAPVSGDQSTSEQAGLHISNEPDKNPD